MTLKLHKRNNYVDPYNTNRNYLRNMTSLQMIPLGKMIWDEIWDERYIYIHIWNVPNTWTFKSSAEISVKSFIDDLNYVIMGL